MMADPYSVLRPLIDVWISVTVVTTALVGIAAHRRITSFSKALSLSVLCGTSSSAIVFVMCDGRPSWPRVGGFLIVTIMMSGIVAFAAGLPIQWQKIKKEVSSQQAVGYEEQK